MVTTSSTCVCRTREVGAFTQSGERRRVHAVPVPCQQGHELVPAPAPEPGGMHENEVCHLTPCRHDRSAACPGSAGPSACLDPALTLAGNNPVLLALPRASLQA